MTDNGINSFIRAFGYLELSLAPGTEDQHRGTISAISSGTASRANTADHGAGDRLLQKDPGWGVMLRCRAHAGVPSADREGGGS